MATVIDVKELVEQGGRHSLYPKDERRVKYYAVRLSERATDAADLVINASSGGTSVPQPGELYPGSSFLRVLNVTPRINGAGGCNWIAEVEYGIDIVSVDGTGPQAPWTRKALFEFGVIRYPYALEKDFSSPPKPVKASSGVPYDPPIETERLNPVVRVHFSKQVGSYNVYEKARDLTGTINAYAVTIYGSSNSLSIASKKGLLRSLTATERVWTTGTHYYDVTAEVEIESQVPVEYIEVADRSYYQLVGGKKKYIKIKDEQGTEYPAATPQYLNGSGVPLTETEVEATNPSKIVYQKYLIHSAESWAGLF